MLQNVPEGFSLHTRKSGMTDPWEPIYASKRGGVIVLGLRAGPPHVNSRGFVHGGLITTLADNAMGLSCAEQIPDVRALVTVSLTVDFLSTAQQGQWMSFETRFVKNGSALSFADCFVKTDDEPCARVSATFRAFRKEA